MEPQFVSRDDLLGDPRFWCLLYEAWLKPCVGDAFEEGEAYFLSTRKQSVQGLIDELGRIPVGFAGKGHPALLSHVLPGRSSAG